MVRSALAALSLCSIAGIALAHEQWLQPEQFALKPGDAAVIEIMNGEAFKGRSLYFDPSKALRLERRAQGETTPLTGILGDRPAVTARDLPEGLNIVAYRNDYLTVDYKTWEKFQSFLDNKDLDRWVDGGVKARHRERGLPETPVREAYRRYAKTLLGVGAATGADQAVGFEIELVALANPYQDAIAEMPVQALYQDKPLRQRQIELFSMTEDGEVAVTQHRTDNRGVVELPVESGKRYMVDVVILREPVGAASEDHEADWESLWASLTFAIPHR